MMTNELPSGQSDCTLQPAAQPDTDADRRQAMERMLGLLAATPAARLFVPRRAGAWGGGSLG